MTVSNITARLISALLLQHLVFHTSIEKLSAALLRKSTLKQNVHTLYDLGSYH